MLLLPFEQNESSDRLAANLRQSASKNSVIVVEENGFPHKTAEMTSNSIKSGKCELQKKSTPDMVTILHKSYYCQYMEERVSY